MSTSTTWISRIKPLPGGVVGRLTPLAVAVILYAVDLLLGSAGYLPEPRYVLLAVPLLSLALLSWGVLPSIIGWFAGVGLIAALGFPGAMVFGLVFPSMFVLGVCCYLIPWRIAAWFPVAAILTLLVLNLALRHAEPAPSILLSTLIALAAAAGLGLNVYRARHETSAARVAQLERERARVRGEERTRLAHELHDIVAHDVTIMAMQARRAEFVKDPQKTSEILAGIGDAAQRTLEDLRSLVLLLKRETDEQDATAPRRAEGEQLLRAADLSGETTTAVGLVHDLDTVVDALRRADFTVQLDINGDVGRVPASLRQALRRTVREVGTNILKHADPGHPVSLRMSVEAESVVLASTNRPARTTPIVSSQTGLEAMAARCDVFGGDMDVERFADSWSICVTIPLRRTPLQGQ